MQRMYAQSYERRFLISKWKDALIFYIHRKKTNASHDYCIAFMCTDCVAESCLSVLSLVWTNLSEMSGYSSLQTLHEFMICKKGAK